MKKLGIEEKAARGEVLWELGLKPSFILKRAFHQYLTLVNSYIFNTAKGCLDSWLLRKMNGDDFDHVSEVTNSAASGIFDPFTVQWSAIGCRAIGLPMECLPRVVPTVGSHLGHFKEFDLPILGMAGDTNAAMFGEQMTKLGDIKITMGTGAFVDLNTGNNPYCSIMGAYPLIGWKIGGKGF